MMVNIREFGDRAFVRDKHENKVPTICETGFDNSASSSQRSAQPSMAERSRSHTTWYSNLLLLPLNPSQQKMAAQKCRHFFVCIAAALTCTETHTL
jgi:hypothetical protein